MRSNYWIKLYHEILTDPKMVGLPDPVWRLCIELFLLAGQEGKAGQLPGTDDIAWILHKNSYEIQAGLERLRRIGIVEQNKEGWLIINFAARQAWTYQTRCEAGYVYLMHRPSDGAYKIGLSKQPSVRLLQVQEQFPGTELIHTIEVDNMQMAEGKLHHQYRDYRMDGEWFKFGFLKAQDICFWTHYQDGEFISRLRTR